MTLREKGFSLENEVSRIEDDLTELEADEEEVKAEAKEYDEKEELTDDEEDRYDTLKRRWVNLQSERSQLEDKKERFEGYIDEWEDTTFRVRELRFGEVQSIKDNVSAESFEVDVELQEISGTPLQGMYQSQVLEKSVTEMPDEAPVNPNDLPEILGDWLFDKAESINALGDNELGNMSLEDAIHSED